MFGNIPPSTIPWLIGSVAFLIFGLRATSNYRKLHNPLSLYFALSGFSACLAFLCWSVPLILTSDLNLLLVINIIGDLFLYIMFVIQVVILHYLALKGRVSLIAVLIPTVLLAVTGWISHCYGYIVGGVSVVNGVYEYELPLIANVIQSIFLIVVFMVGVFMVLRIKQQTETRAKIGLLAIGILYMLSAIGGSLNVLLSGNSNQSPIIIGTYVIGFILFILILLAVRILNPKLNK